MQVPVTVLISGFGPFPGAPVNPTQALATRLGGRRTEPAGLRRIAHVFRTSYAAVEVELPKLIARHRPDVVLLFGLATRTGYLRIETRAINARSVLSPDVDGAWPTRRAIDPQAPSSLRARAPQRALLAAARSCGVPVRLSRDAGRYLCNFTYWRALQSAERAGGPALVQFVHVPLVRAAPVPWRAQLTLRDLERAGEAMLAVLASAARRIASTRSAAAAGATTEFDKTELRQPVAELA